MILILYSLSGDQISLTHAKRNHKIPIELRVTYNEMENVVGFYNFLCYFLTKFITLIYNFVLNHITEFQKLIL